MVDCVALLVYLTMRLCLSVFRLVSTEYDKAAVCDGRIKSPLSVQKEKGRRRPSRLT